MQSLRFVRVCGILNAYGRYGQTAGDGFTFSKKYGQNFLTDGNLLRAIAADAGITKADTVLEIGPGAGALTLALAARAGQSGGL